MTDTFVTLHELAGRRRQVRQAGDAQVASFRLACTAAPLQPPHRDLEQRPTQWYSVTTPWRVLGENCRDSLRRGDPVVVHGRLRAQVWVNNSRASR